MITTDTNQDDWYDFWYNEDVDEIDHYKELEESMELFR